MELKSVIWETLGMMAFTFLVGMGVAYVIKALVELFHFFRPGNVSIVVQDYKMKIAQERLRQANVKKIFSMLEKNTDIDLIKYVYENKNKNDAEEIVDDLYNLSRFYGGIYKDNKENEGITDLIKYYNGEV